MPTNSTGSEMRRVECSTSPGSVQYITRVEKEKDHQEMEKIVSYILSLGDQRVWEEPPVLVICLRLLLEPRTRTHKN